MTQNDKDLLLKYLSMALPYGVIVRHADPLIDNDGNEIGGFWYKRGYLCDITTLDDMSTTIIESEGSDAEGYEHICFLERSLPYLRLMLSMTEEEQKEFDSLWNEGFSKALDAQISGDEAMVKPLEINASYNAIEWLLKNHFDFMGLISKDLAIGVAKDNNPYSN